MADPGPRGGSAWGDALVSWPAALVLLVSGALLGGATPWTSWAIAVVVGAVGVWAAFSGRWSPTRLSLLLAGLAAFTLFQCLPLPAALVRVIAPESAELWERSNALFGDHEGIATVTLEPAATRLEALRLLCYCIFAAVCHHVSRRAGSRGLCAGVALSAAALGVSTIAHQVVGAERVFGWYQPEYAQFVAPLMNPNNLSGALNLGFFCAAGLLVDARSSEAARGFAALACLLCLATSVWLGSRAGVALLFAALAFWMFWEWKRMRREAPERVLARLIPVAAVIALGSAFAAFSVTRLQNELFDDSLSKLDVFAPGFSAAIQHFFVGAGRGAFAVALSPFETASDARFEHAENFLLGWAVEWGTPLALALLVAVGRWLWPRRLAELSPPRFGAYVGLCSLWVHNLADLSLEVPFVALSALAAGAAFGGFTKERTQKGLRWLPTAALLALGLVAASWFIRPVELGRSARYRLARAAAMGPVDRAELRATARAHPADPYLLRLVAAEALGRRDPATLRWLGLALERGPGSARTLLLLADALGRGGHRAQALLTLREVVSLSPELADEAARRALALSPAQAGDIVPQGAHAAAALRALARNAAEPIAQLGFARAAAAAADASADARVELLRRALAASDADCAAALGKPCREALGEWRAGVEAGAPGLVEIDAALLARDGQGEQAFSLLEAGCPRSSAGMGCLTAWLWQGQRLPLPRQLAAADALVAAACAVPARCPGAELDVAEALRARGELRLSLSHLRKAADLVGKPELWLRTAELARDTGDIQVLHGALDELSRLGQTPPAALVEALETLERARLTSPE